MIGTILTVAVGVYGGLYLASKGCSYQKAKQPLDRAWDMLKNQCPCSREDYGDEYCESKEKEKKEDDKS